MGVYTVTLAAAVSLAAPLAAAPPPTHDVALAATGTGCPPPTDEASPDWPGQRRWRAVENAGLTIGEIAIEVGDVYGGRRLAWYQQLANALHVNTRPAVVRSLLPLAPGEPVITERIYRAERRLRAQAFITEAQLVPVRCHDGRVDVAARIRDAWTLQAGASFARAGGDTSVGAGFEDDNFLGTGTGVRIDWNETPQRTTLELGYRDSAVLGSNWRLDIGYGEQSNGRSRSVELDYPFRAPSQRWGARVAVDRRTAELEFDQNSDTAYRSTLDATDRGYELQRLLAGDGAAGWRGGFGWNRLRRDYTALETVEPQLRPAPELTDIDLRGPYAVLERFSERYRTYRNLRSIGRRRDYPLGLSARLVLGRYDDRIGDTDPWFGRIDLDYGLESREREWLALGLGASGRYRDSGDWRAYYRDARVDYYYGTSERNTWVAHGELDWRSSPDADDELYLGGFDGLLAYPERFRVGDRRWLLHLEDRYVSDIVLFDTLQLGYTAYIEAGNVRGLDGGWGEPLADIGVGLRVGSLRSSFGSVTYITVATPLVEADEARSYSVVIGSVIDF